jgi:Xaa-Pro aminopeptidase
MGAEHEPHAGEPPSVLDFSIRERDRRWRKVRELMEMASLDLLVVPTAPDIRYLTQASYDPGPAIFPLRDAVTLLADEGRVDPAARQWVRDVRPVARRWADGLVTRLRELNANGKIIGVVGLDSSAAHPDGNWNYNTFIWMREAFPRTRWVGATSLLHLVRSVKSAEELQALEHAARATDAGLRAAVACFGRGVLDREIQGQVLLAATRTGTELPRRALVGMGPLDQARPPSIPQGHAADEGDVLVAELAGSCLGYLAPAVQLAALGPLPGDWRDAWRVHVDAWNRAWELLRPGTSVGEVDLVARRASAGRFTVRLEIQGGGLGEDLPCFPPGLDERNRPEPTVLQEGMCLELRPSVGWGAPRSRQYLTWSDTVVLTGDGPRRLGSRPREVTVCDA